jgi:hypothetical protein
MASLGKKNLSKTFRDVMKASETPNKNKTLEIKRTKCYYQMARKVSLVKVTWKEKKIIADADLPLETARIYCHAR